MPCEIETGAFAPLERSSTALLTTFRRSGDGVSTPVSVALSADCAYFVTAATSGKAKRLANSSAVTLAPCTVSGAPLGEAVNGQALLLEGPARRRVRRVLRPTGPLFWSFMLYRLRGNAMNLYEVVPIPMDPGGFISWRRAAPGRVERPDCAARPLGGGMWGAVVPAGSSGTGRQARAGRSRRVAGDPTTAAAPADGHAGAGRTWKQGLGGRELGGYGRLSGKSA
jgi:PPOX class probable F420-dependent enzyme